MIEMLSATVRCGRSDSSWKIQAIPASVAAAGLRNVTDRPSSSIVPESGCTTPAMILIRVDLPAPFSPSTAWMRPRSKFDPGVFERMDAAIALGHP